MDGGVQLGRRPGLGGAAAGRAGDARQLGRVGRDRDPDELAALLVEDGRGPVGPADGDGEDAYVQRLRLSRRLRRVAALRVRAVRDQQDGGRERRPRGLDVGQRELDRVADRGGAVCRQRWDLPADGARSLVGRARLVALPENDTTPTWTRGGSWSSRRRSDRWIAESRVGITSVACVLPETSTTSSRISFRPAVRSPMDGCDAASATPAAASHTQAPATRRRQPAPHHAIPNPTSR